MIYLEGVFSPYDIYVITDAVYQRKLQAKTQIEDIEDGRIGPSDYEYWQKIYSDCDRIHLQLMKYFCK